MSEKLNSTAFVIMIDNRFFHEIKNNRVQTAWHFVAAKLFTHDSHYKGMKSPSNIEYIKSQLDARGKKYKIVSVELQLPEKEAESHPYTFVCKGCNHLLNNVCQLRTAGYCYLCDPNITLEELLSDEPITETNKEYLFPTDILI